MPQLDGTGPQGEGSMTGRGLGDCDKNQNGNQPISRWPGRWFRGWGRGRQGQSSVQGAGRGWWK